ncbi:MAG: ATP synthase F0 subunit B [Bacteroidetes bacterium]|nr:MAG: ATP synthase F0 subunit B [Bacteroidota bacterium]MBL1143641.1 ATP synthase F0 subunit B [Bacteroidota bacterium]MCB0803767.1 F0F1 ATP synthase subunit B [Flavobacteriales bacterium]NOG56443.1 F0F1 ATP synthase subunit B [Bacteroidota bacterium]
MEKLLNDFSVGLFFWQMIVFLVLLFLLKKYAWTAILVSVKAREDKIKEGLEAADKAKEMMRQMKEDNEELLAKARLEREGIIKAAREAKDKMISDAKLKASEEADKVIKSAQEAIKAEKNAAMNEIKTHVAELSISIAEKILKKELAADGKQNELIEAAMNESKLN